MVNQMKKFAALILGPLLLLLTACGGSSANVTNLDVDGFASNIKNPGVVVLDVRTPGEFATGHIENAINIDVEGMTFDSEIAKLDKNVEYAVYCRSGRRSAVATEKMAEAGFTKLTNLQDGVISWQSAGYPLVNN
jgi:rhodanese-related sulfurtransferase